MLAAPLTQNSDDPVLQRYRDNFARHLLGISLYLQREIMRALLQEQSYKGLKISFEPYLNLVAESGTRLSELADALGISRQAANQAVNQIENAGYLRREPDPGDRRAKLLVITEQGQRLRRDGIRETVRLESLMADIVGAEALQELARQLYRLNRKLGLLLPVQTEAQVGPGGGIAAMLPRLADYTNLRLMRLTMECGHADLKPSFGQVLTAIGPEGGRIQQMAEAHDISKQAVSAIATELEELGYIYRASDRDDARQVLLLFTGRGRALIADSVASVDQLQDEFRQQLGDIALQGLSATLRDLYHGLQLEAEVFRPSQADNLPTLAQQLRSQLGPERSAALAQLLLNEQATGTSSC